MARLPARLLVVCTANICRSPLAAALVDDLVRHHAPDGARTLEVTSAGTYARPDLPAAPGIVRVATSWGLDLSAHRPRPLVRAVAEAADLVVTMEAAQRDVVAQLAPGPDRAHVHVPRAGGAGRARGRRRDRTCPQPARWWSRSASSPATLVRHPDSRRGTMAISQRERHVLHQTLDELMDPDVADTLMRHLPPGGWANMATKHDLTELEGRLTNRVETLLAREIGGLRSELHTEIGGLRSELHAELHAMARTYLLGNIALVFTVAAIAFGAARLL